MDIVTHALMGLTLATPLLPARPITASCFVLGSVLPDVDALSRCFGKRAFLRCHQTYTHGLPFAAIAAITAWCVLPKEFDEPFAPLALAAGLLLHSAFDVTNTYGTAVLSPLSPRRFRTEWVFFIDALVTMITVITLALQYFSSINQLALAIAYVVTLAIYWVAKAFLRARALRHAPTDTVSMIPSALVPWRYFGCADRGDHLLLFRVNAPTGRTDDERRVPTLDHAYAPLLSPLSDYRTMLALSPAYRVTDAAPAPDGTTLTCRDLRTRNFGGRFGELTVTISPAGQIIRSHLHV